MGIGSRSDMDFLFDMPGAFYTESPGFVRDTLTAPLPTPIMSEVISG